MATRKKNEIFQDEAQAPKKDLPPAVQQHMAAIDEMSNTGGSQPVQTPQQPRVQMPGTPGNSILDMLAKDFGVKIPTEMVPLPSKGMLYPQGHPWHGKEFVDIRSMTASEENILTSESLIKKGTVITELIRSCLVDNVDPLDLLSGDRNALMIAIRVTGYGKQYDGEITCSDCGFKGPRDFDLTQLGIKPLTIEPVTPGENEFQFVLPGLNVPVHFKFQTGRDEQELLRNAEALKKRGITQETMVTNHLQHSIISVNGVSDRAKLAQFVRLMPARDSNALRKFIRDNEPGVDMKIESTCKSCGHVDEVTMPMGVTFLWPNAE